MNKNIILSLIITLTLVINFSCTIKKQEFTVQNFTGLEPQTYADSSGVRFKYDVKLKHFFNFSQTYYIYTELFDKNSNIVYSGTDNNQITIFGNKENWDSISENLQIFIPYDKLKLQKGEHEVELRLRVEGKRVPKDFIFKQNIKVSVPELFQYKDQKMIVNNYNVSKEYHELLLHFDFDLKFTALQTIGFSENKDFENCYLKADLYDKESGNIIEFASLNNPSLLNVDAKYNTSKSCDFLISYTNLKLTAGEYDIICKIQLTNKNSENLGVLHEIEFPFTLPQLYLTEVNMKDVKLISEKKYDVSSLAGRIFSGKDKNRGEGYPDVYWEISTNNEKKFKSEVMNNSFTGPSGSASFIIDDSEKIFLSVCDEDIEFFNDFDLIGKLSVENKKGEFSETFEGKKFGNAICTFDFKKIKYDPQTHYYKISGKY